MPTRKKAAKATKGKKTEKPTKVSSAAKVRVANSLSPFVSREGVIVGADGEKTKVDLGPLVGVFSFHPSELEQR